MSRTKFLIQLLVGVIAVIALSGITACGTLATPAAEPTATTKPSATPTPEVQIIRETVTETVVVTIEVPVESVAATAPPAPNVTQSANPGSFTPGWEADWYRSPFREVTDQLPYPKTHETLAEPGVFPGMGDTQTAWDIMQDEETYLLVPEAGYHYFAIGSYCLWWVDPEASDEQGREVRKPLGCAPAGEERIYLTIVRGYLSDGGDADFNQRVVVTDYMRATGIHHALPAGAYVSLGWVLQQLDNAFEPQPGIEDPNCGDNGCDYPYVVLVDLLTGTSRAWLVGPGLRDWTPVTNMAEMN